MRKLIPFLLLVSSFIGQAGVLDHTIITPEIHGITLKQVSSKLDNAVFEVDVYNPNPFKLPVRTLSGDIFLQNTRVAQLSASSNKSLAAKSTQGFTVPVSVNIDNLFGVIQQIIMSGTAEYRFQGYMMTPIGELPIEQQGTLSDEQVLLLLQTIMAR
ncbi:MAG: LEA type 2 family protein [Gammaproteobacteria bacterium]|nr:LEA type 2 family protein [Gammaproteobacteria bacterium]MDT8371745.1 LEA type 2 family protein [Gammaproteobacteria bacterium]